MAQPSLKVFFDGGCRPNPGRMEAAVVVRGEVRLFRDMGFGTNADAEWLALIRALEVAQSLGLNHVQLIGDALQIVRDADRVLKDGQARPGHATTFLNLVKKGPPARIRWIKREQNLAGIALNALHPR